MHFQSYIYKLDFLTAFFVKDAIPTALLVDAEYDNNDCQNVVKYEFAMMFLYVFHRRNCIQVFKEGSNLTGFFMNQYPRGIPHIIQNDTPSVQEAKFIGIRKLANTFTAKYLKESYFV